MLPLNVWSRGKQFGFVPWAEFCFPDSPRDVSRDEVGGNIRSRGKTNLSFLLPVDCEQSLSFLSVFLAFLRAGVELLSSERLICIILTEYCARRTSGAKTDYS